MKRFWSILSKITLIINPICGVLIVAALISGYWYLTPLAIPIIILVMKFYEWGNKEACQAFDKWWKEMNKTHKYLGECYGINYWENRTTGEILEL